MQVEPLSITIAGGGGVGGGGGGGGKKKGMVGGVRATADQGGRSVKENAEPIMPKNRNVSGKEKVKKKGDLVLSNVDRVNG